MRHKREFSIGQFEEPKILLFLVFVGTMCGLSVAVTVVVVLFIIVS
jgi:hypothetical protein